MKTYFQKLLKLEVRTPAALMNANAKELEALADTLKRARDDALETVRFVSGLEFPDFEQDYEFGGIQRIQSRDFLVRTADLVLDSAEVIYAA